VDLKVLGKIHFEISATILQVDLFSLLIHKFHFPVSKVMMFKDSLQKTNEFGICTTAEIPSK